MSCREAIRRVWPKHLQETAIFVMTKENGTENPNRLSRPNHDGSLDMGCSQVNDKAHFGTKGWTRIDQIYDPLFNAQISYRIYSGRGNWSAWYAVCSPGRVAKYPGIKCN